MKNTTTTIKFEKFTKSGRDYPTSVVVVDGEEYGEILKSISDYDGTVDSYEVRLFDWSDDKFFAVSTHFPLSAQDTETNYFDTARAALAGARSYVRARVVSVAAAEKFAADRADSERRVVDARAKSEREFAAIAAAAEADNVAMRSRRDSAESAATKNKTGRKSLDRLASDPRIESIWSEGEDGYWAGLVEGFNVDGVSCLHEYTVRDLIAAAAGITKDEEKIVAEQKTPAKFRYGVERRSDFHYGDSRRKAAAAVAASLVEDRAIAAAATTFSDHAEKVCDRCAETFSAEDVTWNEDAGEYRCSPCDAEFESKIAAEIAAENAAEIAAAEAADAKFEARAIAFVDPADLVDSTDWTQEQVDAENSERREFNARVGTIDPIAMIAPVAEESPPIVEVVERLRTETEIADAVDFSAFLRRHGRVGVFSEFTYRPFGKTSTEVGTIVRSAAADGTVDSYEVRFGGPAKLAEANRCFAVADYSTARKALVAARIYATAQIVERVLALAAGEVGRRDADSRGEVFPEVKQSMIESFAAIDAVEGVGNVHDAANTGRALEAKLGAELRVSVTEARFEIEVDAPAGHVFSATRSHYLVSSAERSHDDAALSAWRSVIADLRAGVEPCDAPDCDVCWSLPLPALNSWLASDSSRREFNARVGTIAMIAMSRDWIPVDAQRRKENANVSRVAAVLNAHARASLAIDSSNEDEPIAADARIAFTVEATLLAGCSRRTVEKYLADAIDRMFGDVAIIRDVEVRPTSPADHVADDQDDDDEAEITEETLAKARAIYHATVIATAERHEDGGVYRGIEAVADRFGERVSSLVSHEITRDWIG